ncbi:hypothetical protein HMI55_005230 [Coelomomyces lativittatus]|nr:hypothetical protein HMI55_005230 [Coelomomyces lativittatus]
MGLASIVGVSIPVSGGNSNAVSSKGTLPAVLSTEIRERASVAVLVVRECV